MLRFVCGLQVIYVDKRRSTVQVEAGITMGNLNSVLHEFAMGIPSLPPIASQVAEPFQRTLD